MKNRKPLILVGILCLCVIAVLIVRRQQQATQQRDAVAAAVRAAGPSILANTYEMPEPEYKRLMQLKDDMRKTGQIKDADLHWLLALLKPSSGLIVHLRIFAMLQLLGDAPQAQKEKIKSAITPYLQGSDPRYRKAATRVQKFVFNQR